MRVAGIYPQNGGSNNLTIRSTFGEPLGLGKVLGIAQRESCEVHYDAPLDGRIDELLARVESFDPDVVAFSVMTCQFPLAQKLARRLKRPGRDRLIVAGGYHPSAMTFAEPPFDAYVVGEGEIPFEALLQNLKAGRNWQRTPGLLLSSDRTEPPDRIKDLGRYPWALRDEKFLQQSYYGLIYPPPSRQSGFASIEYGRGCLWNCIFCCKNVIWKNGLIFRDPADVVSEMLNLQRDKSVNLFFFTDLNFTSSPNHVMALCNEIKRRKFDAAWFCMSNVATATPELLASMASAGCVKVMYGVESVNDETLHLLRKCGSFEREKQVLQNTLDEGMLPHLFYMIGFTWENTDSIRGAAERLRQLPGLQLRIGTATPLPGAHWYHSMQNLITVQDRRLFDCEHLVFRHDSLTAADLDAAAKYLYEQFYQTNEYRDRAEVFLNKHPHFTQSFTEYAEIMQQAGYAPLKAKCVHA